MKKRIVQLVAAFCAILMLFACGTTEITEIGILSTFKEYDPEGSIQDICTVNGVTMSLNPGTMQIDLEKRENGERVWTWSTYDFYNANPTSASTSYSLFEVECATIGGELTVLDSYIDCIKKNQYVIEIIKDSKGNPNGFKGTFVAGKVSKDRALPEIATKEQFEGWLAQIEPISKRMAKQIKLAYTFFTYEANSDKISDYPQLGTYKDGIYVMKTDVTEREKEIWEESFKQIGLTREDVADLHDSMNYVPQSKNNPVVQFDILFKIDTNGDLVVELPAESILFDNDAYAVNSISLLESLCCVQAKSDNDDTRFIFFPDGSGVVAETNVEDGEGLLAGTVYNSVTDKLKGYFYNSAYGYENIYMPVFGFARSEVSAFAIIEEGAEATRITANYANTTVNSVYPTILFEEYTASRVDEMVDLSESYSLSEDFTYKIRYKFMPGEDVDYIDMAKVYRKYLIDNGQLNDTDSSLKMGYYLETLGYVIGAEDNGFITVDKDKPLTSFQQNIDMINKLTESGVQNISLKLNGWSNGGLSNEYTTEIELSDEMGGEDGWKNLVDCVNKNKVNFYPNVNFMSVGAVSTFDGFSPKNMAIRDNFNTYNGMGAYIQAVQSKGGFSYIINPAKILEGVVEFYEESPEYVSNGISIDYLGRVLPKDYKDGNIINRTQSKEKIEEVLETVKSKGAPILLSGANQYAWKYADVLLDMPTTASMDTAVETVPFLQIVLHGSKAITSGAINMDSNFEDAVLDAMLYGQGVYFTMAADNLMYLKSTFHSYYFSVASSYWLDTSIKAYNLVNSVAGDCINATIENFEHLGDNVYRTTFSNGKWIMVNYGRKDATIEIKEEIEDVQVEENTDDEETKEGEEEQTVTESEPKVLESHTIKAKGYKTSDGKEGTVIE